MDPCLALVHGARQRTRRTLRQRVVAAPLRPMFWYADTPQDRIERAVHRELADLSSRAARAMATLACSDGVAPLSRAAGEALARGEGEGWFPRSELEAIARRLCEAPRTPDRERLDVELNVWIDKHRRFERRLRWLLDPELTRAELPRLDPQADADQIWCFVKYDFRPEFLFSAWGNAIERIAQSEATSTFFHSTGTAESTPVKRSEDTLIHYYYFFNWGTDSYHGRKAIESMNFMHGRYFIHNDGMKYVLLNAAFTVLHALGAVGHRPLTDTERLGYFHAQINMGQAMRIQELTHSWDEMHEWFTGLNRSLSGYAPQKRRMWNALEDNFDRSAGIPGPVGWFRRRLEVAGMDDTYRSALGFRAPSRRQVWFLKGVVRGVNRARVALRGGPYIESLQNFITYPDGVDIEHAGEKKRSPKLPAACPFSGKALGTRLTHGGSDDLPPLLHAREAPDVELRTIAWDEIRRHATEDDLWVVFGGHVYDVSSFARNHPGGLQILVKGAGRDMTRAFEHAKHSELTKIFALNFRIGRVDRAVPAPQPPVQVTSA